MKKVILLLAALALATPLWAQSSQELRANFAHLYDLDSTSLTYCVMTGNGSPFGPPNAGTLNVETSGSSATVTAVSGTPFTDLAVGDTITGYLSTGVSNTVVIVAKATGAEVTVSSAVNWDETGGVPFTWWDQTCGTAATNGWIPVLPAKYVGFSVYYVQGDLDALSVTIECRRSGIGAQPEIVYPGPDSNCGNDGTLGTNECEFATDPAELGVVDIAPTYRECRVGLRVKTTDASDTTTNLEQITAVLTITR